MNHLAPLSISTTLGNLNADLTAQVASIHQSLHNNPLAAWLQGVPVKVTLQFEGAPAGAGTGAPVEAPEPNMPKILQWVYKQRYVTFSGVRQEFGLTAPRANRLVAYLIAKAIVGPGQSRVGHPVLGQGPTGPDAVEEPPGRRPKRSRDEIEAVKVRLAAHIKAHPGQRVDQINATLGTVTADLDLPLKELYDEGVITTAGQRRGMSYLPATPKKAKPSGGKKPSSGGKKPSKAKPVKVKTNGKKPASSKKDKKPAPSGKKGGAKKAPKADAPASEATPAS